MGTTAKDVRTAAESGNRWLPPAGALGWLPPQFWWTTKEWFGYNVDFLPLAALAPAATQPLNIQADADFIIMYATAVETDTTDAILQPFMPLLVNIKDQSAGAFFTANPVHANMFFGDAQNPGIFVVPYYMRAGTSMNITIQNLENVARNLRICFWGFRSDPGSDVRGD